MNKKVYLVLSIRDINRLLRLAKRDSRLSYSGKVAQEQCTVLDMILTDTSNASDGSMQVSSASFRDNLKAQEERVSAIETLRRIKH